MQGGCCRGAGILFTNHEPKCLLQWLQLVVTKGSLTMSVQVGVLKVAEAIVPVAAGTTGSEVVGQADGVSVTSSHTKGGTKHMHCSMVIVPALEYGSLRGTGAQISRTVAREDPQALPQLEHRRMWLPSQVARHTHGHAQFPVRQACNLYLLCTTHL